ncbi:hypothetical protein GCM10028807_44910 [Spirosoma daeguense]
MEHKHQLKSLSQTDNGYVGYCAGCQSYNVAFKNSLFILSEEEFTCYRQVMLDRTAMSPFFTTHGKEWLLKTPMPNYFILFSDPEIDELIQMLNEAHLLREVEQILEAPTNR